ncbi:MAG: SDR family oxidoreductase [Deltaproteobacteria bacterium]|nr:SDR family oxidoreductase [Deltaproteobacteria bacterium]
MILFVGATGKLGSAAVRELAQRGKKIRCLVRPGSDVSGLAATGAEIVRGDLRDQTSVKQALESIDTVISSFATNIAKERSAAALWANDYEGNLTLIRLSREAGVRKFFFVSYWGLAKFGDFEHGKIKKMVEDLLTVSGLDYTVFRVTTLATDMSELLGATLLRKGRVPLLMKPHEKIRPILLEDLAWCMADAIDNPKACRRIIEVAGEEEYDFRSFEQLFCRALGKKVRFIFVPLPLASFAASCIDFATGNRYNARGILSAFTGGSTCDISDMKSIFDVRQGSFARYLQDFFQEARNASRYNHSV